MKFKMMIGSFVVGVNGERAVVGSIDHEEIDGWTAALRGYDGEWTTWTRADGARVERARPGCWRATRGKAVLRDAMGRQRSFRSAAGARTAVGPVKPALIRRASP